jgi:hypothetical protein
MTNPSEAGRVRNWWPKLASAVVVPGAVLLFAVSATSQPLRIQATAHESRAGASGAGSFIKRWFELETGARRDYATSWLLMDPAQQRHVPRSLYVSCSKASWRTENEAPNEIDRFIVIRTSRTTAVIPGTALKVPMVRVIFQIRWRAPDGTRAWTNPFDTVIVPVGGGFRWRLTLSNYKTYAAGGCPT